MSCSKCSLQIRMSPRYSLCSDEMGPTFPSCMISAKPMIAVQRRAQLVRHVGEKLAFKASGILDAPALLYQLGIRCPQLFFERLLLGAIFGDQEVADGDLVGVTTESDRYGGGKSFAVLTHALENTVGLLVLESCI